VVQETYRERANGETDDRDDRDGSRRNGGRRDE
jgi:hypothetical protein